MKVGYARVSTSTGDQRLDLQLDALTQAGCEKIFTDTASGAIANREGLEECLSFVRPGDVVVVWKLDRLARSLTHLINVVNDLERRQVGFQSLTESIDTTTPTGRLIFHIFGALGEFERSLIIERTKAGLAAAKLRGRLGGRPRKMNPEKLKLASSMLKEPSTSVSQVCRVLGVSRASLYRYLPVKDLKPIITRVN